MTSMEIQVFLRENAYPFYASQDDNYEDGWQDGAYRALLHSLSTEELTQLVGMLERDYGCPPTLYFKACGILKRKQNAKMDGIPTSVLLRWYKDKKSKKVGAAAEALKARFNRETEEGRRAILKAFLMGGIKELEWAARYLRYHWTRSMTTLVECRWKMTRNPVLAQVVLRHLPESFVMAEQEPLAEAAGYVFVCARLGKRKDFHIDANRLTVPDYLYVLAKNRADGVDPQHIETRLEEYLDQSDWLSHRDIGLILWALGKLSLTETVIRTRRRLLDQQRKGAESIGNDAGELDFTPYHEC